jgi:hypothetical protein
MSLLHSSTRRPAPLKDTDYDHEIRLVDHTKPASVRSQSAGEPPASPGVVSDSSSRWHSDAPLRKAQSTLNQELTQLKYSKYQDRRLGDGGASDDGQLEEGGPDNNGAGPADEGERGRTTTRNGGLKKAKSHKPPESTIDILYENQRGGFMCGLPLFSSSALGNLDPAPWTNIAQKTSATNITNAQVPDPSWEWAWKDWSINHSDEVDEDGWEYSFAFAKQFSWHGPAWWNSFVRRRAWIRKRVKRHSGYSPAEAHMLNSDYFTIYPAQDRSRSRASTMDESTRNRYSIASLAGREMEDVILVEDIHDIASLMQALRFARIDREKLEAVESFIQHGGNELYYLRERMHDIMGMFIFQAARRLLLSHLLKIFNEASDQQNEGGNEKDTDPINKRRFENLEAAVKHADEEVKKLEFWSDVKDMTEKGETKGAVDESQGWDNRWTGLDGSGPKDVISNHNLPGVEDCKVGEENGTAMGSGSEKGKGKAKE